MTSYLHLGMWLTSPMMTSWVCKFTPSPHLGPHLPSPLMKSFLRGGVTAHSRKHSGGEACPPRLIYFTPPHLRGPRVLSRGGKRDGAALVGVHDGVILDGLGAPLRGGGGEGGNAPLHLKGEG